MPKLLKTAQNSIIPMYIHRVCELALEKLSGSEIAEIINNEFGFDYSKRTVNWWISKTGPYYDYFIEYATEENEQRAMIANNIFKANVDKAQITLAGVMSGKKGMGVPQVMAAKEWLDRSLGKVTDKVDLNAQIGLYTFADWALAQAEKLKQEQDETTNQSADKISKGTG